MSEFFREPEPSRKNPTISRLLSRYHTPYRLEPDTTSKRKQRTTRLFKRSKIHATSCCSRDISPEEKKKRSRMSRNTLFLTINTTCFAETRSQPAPAIYHPDAKICRALYNFIASETLQPLPERNSRRYEAYVEKNCVSHSAWNGSCFYWKESQQIHAGSAVIIIQSN